MIFKYHIIVITAYETIKKGGKDMIVLHDVKKAAAHDLLRELGKEYFRLAEPDDKLGVYPKITCENEISLLYRHAEDCVMLESPRSISELSLNEFSDIRIF